MMNFFYVEIKNFGRIQKSAEGALSKDKSLYPNSPLFKTTPLKLSSRALFNGCSSRWVFDCYFLIFFSNTNPDGRYYDKT